MSRWFNTAGPCQADIHYMLSPTSRMPNLEQLIEQRSYFVIHAPRRVQAIIEPILAGQTLGDTPSDDRQYLIYLGLLRRDPEAGLTIANPIYREVIPRVLVQGTQDSLPYISPSWLTSNKEKIGS